MTDIILYHYETSPYSEKVRLGLGLKGLAWGSAKGQESLRRDLVRSSKHGDFICKRPAIRRYFTGSISKATCCCPTPGTPHLPSDT